MDEICQKMFLIKSEERIKTDPSGLVRNVKRVCSFPVGRVRQTRPVAAPRLHTGWDGWTERPLWTAGCFCGGGRPARRGAEWAAGWGACTDTVYRRPAEQTKQDKRKLNSVCVMEK